MPYIIFAILGILQVVSVFWLPETLGVPMLTTLEEAEEFYKTGKVYSKDDQEKPFNQSKSVL